MALRIGLSGVEARWAEIIGRAFVPRGAWGGTLDGAHLGEELRAECLASPWYLALALRAALLLFWLAPLFGVGRVRRRTFGALGLDEQEAVLEALLGARLYVVRTAGLLLKLTFCTIALGDARALAKLNAYGLGEDRRPGRRRLPLADGATPVAAKEEPR